MRVSTRSVVTSPSSDGFQIVFSSRASACCIQFMWMWIDLPDPETLVGLFSLFDRFSVSMIALVAISCAVQDSPATYHGREHSEKSGIILGTLNMCPLCGGVLPNGKLLPP